MAHVLKANLSYITRLFLKMERRRGEGKEVEEREEKENEGKKEKLKELTECA